MKITGTTQLFFTIGEPVAQVRAPELFNAVFAAAGVDAVVVPARVTPEHLEAFVRATLSSPTVRGLFVAIPHKAPALRLADRVTRVARIAGATNAVRRGTDNQIEADLFDGVAFLRAVVHFGIGVSGRRVLIVGAGGAGCAIGASLADAGVASVDLFDSVPGKAAAAAQSLAEHFTIPFRALPAPDPSGYQLVVNASPTGLRPDDPLPIDVAALEADVALVNIIMTPRPTRLVEGARRRGVRAFPGYEMLVQQVPPYLRFFGYEELAASMERDLSSARQVLVSSGAGVVS